MTRVEWTKQRAARLSSVLDGTDPQFVSDKIRTGRFELYEHAESLVCIERQLLSLHVWAVVGSGLKECADAIATFARCTGFWRVTFRTQHPGVPRLVSHLQPQPCARDCRPQDMEFEIWLLPDAPLSTSTPFRI